MTEEFIIHKPKPLIYISNDLSKRERLVLNFIIYIAKNQIKNENIICDFKLVDIKNICKINDFKIIREILNKIYKDTLNTNLLKEEKPLKIIENLTITSQKVEILFSEDFFNLLNKNSYASIDLKQQLNLKSKYSILLYEMIIDYYRESNHYMQIPHIKIEVFKKLMGLKNKKNDNDLKRKVLDRVVKEIESETDFYLQYELLKKHGSSKYNYIKFEFSKRKLRPRKSNEEILKEIERQREKLKLEKEEWREERIRYEKTISRYRQAMREFDNWVWEQNDEYLEILEEERKY